MKTSHLDKVVKLLLDGLSAEAVKTACIEKLRMKPARADALVSEARRRITVAADYNRDEQLGIAVERLNEIFRLTKDADPKTALMAQKEINRLMGLYLATPEQQLLDAAGVTSTGEAAQVEETELTAIRRHLAPLKLSPKDYPLREQVRILADRIREVTASRTPAAATPKPPESPVVAPAAAS